ncbi:hypothetical protein HOLleu_17565 [Holothuria leucospilota]|uniref:Uncharacterized protein n=1 Tax=Holothuria leucospilota TaxID=206669 RepID=A0A9Q1C0K1_HOLLE|nr:hypothetical protein HOLleu_17565 [Holothuria leucospilota]
MGSRLRVYIDSSGMEFILVHMHIFVQPERFRHYHIICAASLCGLRLYNIVSSSCEIYYCLPHGLSIEFKICLFMT